MTFKVIKTTKRSEPDLGDHLFGEEYIEELREPELHEFQVLPLSMWNSSTWEILIKLGHDPEALKEFKNSIKYP